MTAADIEAVRVGDVFNSISAVNAAREARYEKSAGEQKADAEFARISRYLDKNSTAYKIVKDADSRKGLTEKQQWAIAYGLMKNKKYLQEIAVVKKEKAAERDFYKQNKDIISANKKRLKQEKEARRKMTRTELTEFHRTGQMPPNWQEILKR